MSNNFSAQSTGPDRKLSERPYANISEQYPYGDSLFIVGGKQIKSSREEEPEAHKIIKKSMKSSKKS